MIDVGRGGRLWLGDPADLPARTRNGASSPERVPARWIGLVSPPADRPLAR